MTYTADILERHLVGDVRPRDPRCKACNLPADLPNVGAWRREVARMYMEGWGVRPMYREVLPLMRSWPPGPEGHRMSYSAFNRHLKHLESTIQAIREAGQEEAALEGLDLDALNGRYLSARATMRLILQVGVHDLVAGRIRVSAQDLLRIAAMERGREREEELLRENQRLASSLSLVVSLIQQLAPPEVQQAIYARFKSLQKGGERGDGRRRSREDGHSDASSAN